nr:MMPL family transporter [Mycobacterium lepromatosis]
MAIVAATEYGIFLADWYPKAHQVSYDQETIYHITFRNVTSVVLEPSLAIAKVAYCPSFAKLAWVQVAIVMLAVVFAGLTLGPAVIFAGSCFGLFERK